MKVVNGGYLYSAFLSSLRLKVPFINAHTNDGRAAMQGDNQTNTSNEAFIVLAKDSSTHGQTGNKSASF